MKKNPFYGMSAAAMLFGCYMVSSALRLEPGHLGKLLVLIGVLQVYEGLLIALGLVLVSTGKAPRDGVTVLLLETLFLLDATLLGTECVTAETGAGTVTAVALVLLAVVKLGVVHRLAPRLLPRPVAVLLGLQAALVLALPVGAAHLAGARILSPGVAYAFWWMAILLPLGRQRLLATTREADGTGAEARALAAWSWAPTVSVLLHLWSVGWIHQVDFHAAYAAPFVLGLALVTGPRHTVAQILLPAFALLISVGQGEALGFPPSAADSGWPSPLRCAAFGAAFVYGVLAWRHRHPWLLGLAAVSGLTGLAGTGLSSFLGTAGALWRWIGRVVPRGSLGWGVAAVAAAFAFLAAGAWSSLRGDGRPPSRPRRPRLALPGGSVTLALTLAALCWAAILLAVDSAPFQERALLGHAAWLSLATVALGLGALVRTPGRPEGGPAKGAGVVALLAGGASVLFVFGVLSTTRHQVPHNERSAIGDVRTVMSAQAAYQSANGGYFEGDLSCLADPTACLPGYGADQPSFLDDTTASLVPKRGYARSFHPGLPPGEIRLQGSPTSVTTWAYVAVPTEPGRSGLRSFCGDSTGLLCFRADGGFPTLDEEGTCDPEGCGLLQ